MARKRDWKPLLDAFKPEADIKPKRRRCRVQIDPAIRLPSWERLLEIDRKTEAAASIARIDAGASKRGNVAADT